MDPALISQISTGLAVLTIIGQIILGILLIALILRKKAFGQYMTLLVGKNGIRFSLLIALVATMGSLFYSDVAGFTPCKLCWYQRILMYPQVLLFGTALWKGDKGIIDYGIVLSTIGLIMAGYHYLLQIGVVPELPCSTVGFSISCAERFVMNFGYITIPLMSFTAFALILLFLGLQKYHSTSSQT